MSEIATKSTPPLRSQVPGWIRSWALGTLWVLLGLVLLYMARQVLAPFVVAGVLAYIFNIVVDRVEGRLRWPRVLVVALLYLLVLGTIAVGLYFGVEALYHGTQQLITHWRDIVERGVQQVMGGDRYDFSGQVIDAHLVAAQITQGVGNLLTGGNTVKWVEEGARLLWEALLVVVISFYLLLDGRKLGVYLLKFVPTGARARAVDLAGRVHTMLGAYLRGQFLLMGLIATQSFLLLHLVFHVPHALPLSILTGFLEILPLVGPLAATSVAAAVAFSAHGAGAAIGIVVGYLVLRQLEDQFIGPLLLGRAVNIHPVAAIFAVLAGGAIAGVLGMLLAIPAAATIKIALDFLYPAEPANPDPALNVPAAEQQGDAAILQAEDVKTTNVRSTSTNRMVAR